MREEEGPSTVRLRAHMFRKPRLPKQQQHQSNLRCWGRKGRVNQPQSQNQEEEEEEPKVVFRRRTRKEMGNGRKKGGGGRAGGHRWLHLSLAACRYIKGEEEEEGLFILGVQGMRGV